MAKAHFGVTSLSSDFKRDVGADPFLWILGELEEGVDNAPSDLLVRDKLGDLLFGVVDVFVPIGELFTQLGSAPFDLARPPSANVDMAAKAPCGGWSTIKVVTKF